MERGRATQTLHAVVNFIVVFHSLPQVWNCDIIVDWADPQEEPDEQTMSKVKVLYVRNLTQDTSEEKLKVRLRRIYLLPKFPPLAHYLQCFLFPSSSLIGKLRTVRPC